MERVGTHDRSSIYESQFLLATNHPSIDYDHEYHERDHGHPGALCCDPAAAS